MKKELTINGESHQIDIEPAERLLPVLRGRLGLTGTKEACGVGECGACTVLIGGRPQQACVTLAVRVDEPVLTIEGLDQSCSGLGPAFAEHGGFQCGFCTPGQMMSGYALTCQATSSQRDLTDEEIRKEMTGNVCRCTGYAGIVRAVLAQVESTRLPRQ